MYMHVLTLTLSSLFQQLMYIIYSIVLYNIINMYRTEASCSICLQCRPEGNTFSSKYSQLSAHKGSEFNWHGQIHLI